MHDRYYDRKKNNSSRLFGGCAITTISITGPIYVKSSDLRKIIRFLRKIECIKFECNEFVLVLFKLI